MTERSGNDGRGPRQAGAVSRLSIGHTLPLMIGMLLLIVILVITSAAYFEMRRTSLDAASARLVNITNQFRDLFQQSGVQVRGQALASLKKPALAAFARTRDPALKDSAMSALVFVGPQPEQTAGSQLRDATGAVLLSNASPSFGLDTISTADVSAQLSGKDSLAVGRLRFVSDTMVYPVAAKIPNSNGTYVVHWRKLVSTRRAREQINQLIGSDASLFLGNADFSAWTDLERPVAVPLIDHGVHAEPQQYTRADSNSRRLIETARIPGTPWVVAVEIPVATVFAPINGFLRRIALIALVALAVALLAAWIASRRITGPLVKLTHAADLIASGNPGGEVHIDRSDELGRLAHSFAMMANEVQLARADLERKVDERTRDLNATMQQLGDAQESLVRREKLAMLGQLASGVGHELRNPLGVMTNAVYYLKLVLSASPQNVQEYLEILQQQITLSEKIVSDLLDFARLRPPQRESASVAAVTQAQIARLGSTDNVEIDVELPADLPNVLVDSVQMGQIILNLLTNGIQALDGPGRLTIRAATSAGQVHLDVTDSGSGIRPENMEKIFEPLFTTKARGIGLGLAVSRTLARANGGDLSASSPPGEGASFRMTLESVQEVA